MNSCEDISQFVNKLIFEVYFLNLLNAVGFAMLVENEQEII